MMKPKDKEKFFAWAKEKAIEREKEMAVRQAEADALMIKIEDLIIGKTYIGEGRNFQEGEWNGDGFYGLRYKFGDTFVDMELHWDADPHYGTFRPMKLK